MIKHVLIPTDGSRRSAKAIKAGVALAKEMGARVTAFHGVRAGAPDPCAHRHPLAPRDRAAARCAGRLDRVFAADPRARAASSLSAA